MLILCQWTIPGRWHHRGIFFKKNQKTLLARRKEDMDTPQPSELRLSSQESIEFNKTQTQWSQPSKKIWHTITRTANTSNQPNNTRPKYMITFLNLILELKSSLGLKFRFQLKPPYGWRFFEFQNPSPRMKQLLQISKDPKYFLSVALTNFLFG